MPKQKWQWMVVACCADPHYSMKYQAELRTGEPSFRVISSTRWTTKNQAIKDGRKVFAAFEELPDA